MKRSHAHPVRFETDHIVHRSPEHNDDAADLKRRVVNFLATKNRPGLRLLEVEVNGDVVILRGRVRSYYEKQLAGHLCERVAGVLRVMDDIDVVDDNDAIDEPTADALAS